MRFPASVIKFSNKLLGSPVGFSLENRIFHGANIVTVILLACAIVVNGLLGLYDALPVLFAIMAVHCLLYYLSRYRRKFKIAVWGLAFIGYGGMIASFFNKSGVDGPAVFISFFVSQLLITVTSKKYHIYFLLLNFCIVGALFYVESRYNGLIKYIYKNRETRLVDYYFTFVIISIFSYLITRVLSDNYNAEKKKAEQQTSYIAEKHHELQTATREKERLFSLVFHDLRNPLSSIQFYLEQYADNYHNKKNDEEIRKQLLALTQSTSSMMETMLEWIRGHEKALLKKEKEIDIQDVILNAISTELPFAMKRKVNLSYTLQDRIAVKADPVIVLLLLRTIINNAVKATRKNDTVTVTAENRATSCVVSVIDKGMGIRDEEKQRIFTVEPGSFHDNNSEKGMGIGLVLAKQFAESQGIHLDFESNYGIGSTFYFTIDRKRA